MLQPLMLLPLTLLLRTPPAGTLRAAYAPPIRVAMQAYSRGDDGGAPIDEQPRAASCALTIHNVADLQRSFPFGVCSVKLALRGSDVILRMLMAE